MSDYLDVWNEPQNASARDAIRTRLNDGFTVELLLQPGDCTRYHLILSPSMQSSIEVSDDGREPRKLGRWGDELVVVLMSTKDARAVGGPFMRGGTEDQYLAGLKRDLAHVNGATLYAIAATIAELWKEIE